jgi:hypothetical protein
MGTHHGQFLVEARFCGLLGTVTSGFAPLARARPAAGKAELTRPALPRTARAAAGGRR